LFDADLPGARAEVAQTRRDLPDHLRHATFRYVELLTRARVCRYATDPVGAWAAFRQPPGRWGMALMLQRAPFQTFYAHERGTSAVAAAAEATRPRDRAAALHDASQCVERLTAQGTAWAAAMARPIQASLAALAGDRDEVARQLRWAVEDFSALRMALYATASRWRLGEHTDDAPILAAAERSLRAQGIADPPRMVALLVPPIRTGPKATDR
jgi:hypothetical protein